MPTLAFAMCGSFCTFEKALAQLALLRKDWDMLPVMSETAYTTDTRFGTAESFHERIENICGRKIIHTIAEAEPIGPKRLAGARRAVHGKHRCEDCKCRNGYSRHDGSKIRPARLHARCTVPRHKRCSRCVVQKHRSAYEHEKHLFCAPRTGRPHKKAEFSRRTFRPNSRNACKRRTRRTVAACFAMKCAAKGS